MKNFLKSLASILAKIVKTTYKVTKVAVKGTFRTARGLIAGARGGSETPSRQIYDEKLNKWRDKTPAEMAEDKKGIWRKAWEEEYPPAEPETEETVEEVQEPEEPEVVEPEVKSLPEPKSQVNDIMSKLDGMKSANVTVSKPVYAIEEKKENKQKMLQMPTTAMKI